MTVIEITGLVDDLRELHNELQETLNKERLEVEVELQKNRYDALDSGTIELISVSFTGVIAISNVINVILNIQGRKQRTTNSKSNSSVSLNIEVGNGQNLNMQLPTGLSDEEIRSYSGVANNFVDRISKSEDQILRGDSRYRTEIDFYKINRLFEELFIETEKAREMHSRISESANTLTSTVEMLETNLIDLLAGANKKCKFYLPVDDIENCEKIFFRFEIENILDFRQVKHDIKALDMNNIFVRYEVKKLELFGKIVRNPRFKFYSTFKD